LNLNKDLFREKEVANLVGMSASKLRQYRTQRRNTGQVPESFRVGGKVYYSKDDLIYWLLTQGHELLSLAWEVKPGTSGNCLKGKVALETNSAELVSFLLELTDNVSYITNIRVWRNVNPAAWVVI
jgi:hypothetical protein